MSYKIWVLVEFNNFAGKKKILKEGWDIQNYFGCILSTHLGTIHFN